MLRKWKPRKFIFCSSEVMMMQGISGSVFSLVIVDALLQRESNVRQRYKWAQLCVIVHWAQDVAPILACCWASVVDSGPAASQNWGARLAFAGRPFGDIGQAHRDSDSRIQPALKTGGSFRHFCDQVQESYCAGSGGEDAEKSFRIRGVLVLIQVINWLVIGAAAEPLVRRPASV